MMKPQPIYLEADTYRVGLAAVLLQIRNGTSCSRDKAPDNNILTPTAFVSMSLSSKEKRYSNIEKEALNILYGLEKFHHYCFVRQVSIITDHKLLVAIFKKRCSNAITEHTMNSSQNTPLQSQNHIQYIYIYKYIYRPGS